MREPIQLCQEATVVFSIGNGILRIIQANCNKQISGFLNSARRCFSSPWYCSFPCRKADLPPSPVRERGLVINFLVNGFTSTLGKAFALFCESGKQGGTGFIVPQEQIQTLPYGGGLAGKNDKYMATEVFELLFKTL